MSPWRDKVAIVTGGSAGLGFAIAREFGQAGARVMLVGRDRERLEKAVNDLSSLGIDVANVAADLTVANAAESIVTAARERWGRIDVLVNNAGLSMRGRVTETTPDDFRRLLEVNFLAAVGCTRACLDDLRRTRGHVVNIGSLAAKSAGAFLGAYPASKFPLAAYSQQLRLELADEGLHVLLVCPGPIDRPDAGARYDEQTANLPPEARRPGGGVRLKRIDPAYLAVRIRRACERRTPELVVPGKARWLFALAQLCPTLGDWLVRRAMRRS